MRDTELHVIVPVFNEDKNFAKTYQSIREHLGPSHRIVVVYDFDEDTTVPVVRKLAEQDVNLMLLKNTLGRGPANALRAGFNSVSSGPVLVVMADLADDLKDVPAMMELYRKGSDIVCGSRYMRGGRQVGGPPVKRVLSRLAGLSLYYLRGIPTHDITNNFKLYDSGVLKNITIESKMGFSIAMEITVKAFLTGKKITEVPTTWRDRTEGEAKFKLFKWLPQYLHWYFLAFRPKYTTPNRAFAALMGVVLVLTFVPVLDIFLVLGNSWQGITPTFIDENFYQAHVQNIGEGYINDGNPYFLEHRYGPPLVIFGGAWLNALPLLAGISFNATLLLNFVLWSLVFAALFYWLFRELAIPSWIAVVGTLLQYLQFYPYMWRPANLQPVLPFYILFSIALVRLVREQNRKNIYLLAAATAVSFYLYAYLWQTVLITLGLLFLYALALKNWKLMRATLLSSFIGGVIGLPVPLYTLWLSYSSPYFLESISRFGLVNTHLPMAEVVYSGGWVGIILVFVAILFWRSRALRADTEFVSLGTFLSLSGLGLWVMQGSNLFTGKLLETGEHIRVFIFPWLAFSTILLGAYLWKRRAELAAGLQTFACVVVAICAVVSVRYAYAAFSPFSNIESHREYWQTQQVYAKPLAWLENNEADPVAVWNEPHDPLSPLLPIFTKHFVLFVAPAMWQLVSDDEFRERYLVSQYFNNPTVASLKNDMALYLGRQDIAHNAKTIERGIKICRILFFWDAGKDCGTPPTAVELLGEEFFSDLEQKFLTDIKPNIKEYLKKYHVSYILKDTTADSQYRPEKLGATRVYDDGRFEMYSLP